MVVFDRLQAALALEIPMFHTHILTQRGHEEKKKNVRLPTAMVHSSVTWVTNMIRYFINYSYIWMHIFYYSYIWMGRIFKVRVRVVMDLPRILRLLPSTCSATACWKPILPSILSRLALKTAASSLLPPHIFSGASFLSAGRGRSAVPKEMLLNPQLKNIWELVIQAKASDSRKNQASGLTPVHLLGWSTGKLDSVTPS